MTPIAPSTRPPHHRRAAATPALRGPARSTHPPNTAADMPRNTKNSVYIQPRLATFQSHVVVTSSAKIDISAHVFDAVKPIARDSGSQNTENPYAMPMQRWMQRAAGGTSQRLKPAVAMMRSRSRMLAVRLLPANGWSIVVMRVSPWDFAFHARFCGGHCRRAKDESTTVPLSGDRNFEFYNSEALCR